MFRYCRSCGLDFDDVPVEAEPTESQAPPSWRPPRRSRPVRRYIAIGVGVLFALGAIGNLTGRGAETPQASNLESPAAVVSTATPRATTSPQATTPPTERSALDVAPQGPTVEATVVRVIDGDTIVVEFGGTEYHLRYIGMDTPESVKPGSPVEELALAATAANEALVAGRTVILEKDVSEVDQFGRLLRDVWVQAGGKLVLVGVELVRTGFAQVTTYPPDVRYVDLLLAAQSTARSAAVGLWSAPAAATPKPTPTKAAPRPLVGGSNCHPSYSNCLPIVADLDCPDVRAMGKAPVTVKGPDEYRLDRDNDGLGCE